MRVVFAIAILVLGFISVRSQDFYVSPAYYPIEIEIDRGWQPSEATGINLSYEPEWGVELPSFWQKHKKGLLVTGIQLATITLDAVGDAVYDIGKETGNSSKMFWGHTMQATAVAGSAATLVSLSWDGNWWDGVRFSVGYLALRYATFDLAYNLTRGIDPLYADGLKAEMPPHGRVWTQAVAFTFGVSFNIKEF